MDGDYWEAMIDKGQWREIGQDTGVTHLLFTMSVMGFLTFVYIVYVQVIVFGDEFLAQGLHLQSHQRC